VASALTLPAWPALSLVGTPLPQRISYERGVWGKAHGSRSDYRWIASTPAFAPAKLQLEGKLQLGTEDVPLKATHWLTMEDQCFAVVCYPSRAMDSSGRTGFLEKQVFAWRRSPEIPAALGALALLPQVAQADDSVWWERQSPRPWSDEDITLSLIPSQHPPLPVDVAEIAASIEAGIADLRRVIREEPLSELYARLLSGQRGIPVEGLTAPLSAQALAALFLPLPRAVADGLSLAGWLPSQRLPNLDALRRSWSVVLGGSALPPAPTEAPTAEQKAEARRLARALLANDPALLQGTPVPVRSVPAPRTSRQVRLAMWGPASAGKTAFLAKLFLEDQDSEWEISTSGASLKFFQDMRSFMSSNNAFPPATTVAEPIEYEFLNRRKRIEATLRLEDRSGVESMKLSDELKRQLVEADGLVLLFDPFAEGTTLENQVRNTLEQVHVARGRGSGKDDRPIAACLSKVDFFISSVAEWRHACDDPVGFVRHHDHMRHMGLERAVSRRCENYRLFPVSAAGVRLRYGVVEPVVFYDESLRPRLSPGGKPLHLMSPFAWILDQVTARS
jgi:hypothetical protein